MTLISVIGLWETGFRLNIWEFKWLPRLGSFSVVTLKEPKVSLLRVADLTDRVVREWTGERIDNIFLPANASIVKEIPLCTSWPSKKVM